MDGKEIRRLLGDNLKFYRGRLGWSQSALAERANISLTYLGDIERGNKWPFPDTLSSLAQALGVGVRDLFNTDEPAVQSPDQIAMERFFKEVSLTINHSLDRIRRKYLPPAPPH